MAKDAGNSEYPGPVVTAPVVDWCNLQAKAARKEEHKALYKQRWAVELDIRHIKETMGMNILSYKTPDMALKEVWVYLLAYNLIRLLMAQSAFTADIMPRDISFKHCLQLWLLWSQQADTSDDEQLYGLYMLIAQQRVGKRPGRIEPRAVKRRPKAYPLLTVPRPEAQENIRKKWPLEEAKVSAILVRPQFLRRTGLSQMPRPTKCFGCVGL